MTPAARQRVAHGEQCVSETEPFASARPDSPPHPGTRECWVVTNGAAGNERQALTDEIAERLQGFHLETRVAAIFADKICEEYDGLDD